MENAGKNLLIIISDEHRKDAMGCMGHPLVKTPHLDALAARGTVFENAYTPSPMCVPTRAALACGIMFIKSETGIAQLPIAVIQEAG